MDIAILERRFRSMAVAQSRSRCYGLVQIVRRTFFQLHRLYHPVPSPCMLSILPCPRQSGRGVLVGRIYRYRERLFRLGPCSVHPILDRCFELLWEGYPWKYLEADGNSTWWKGLILLSLTIVLGIVILFVLLKIMTYFWDEPFMGGQYTGWTGFSIDSCRRNMRLFYLGVFYSETLLSTIFQIWIAYGCGAVFSTLIAIGGGMLFYGFYYSPLATFFLAKVPGVAQPGDTPLVWTILFLSIVMIQADFFDGWPLKRK